MDGANHSDPNAKRGPLFGNKTSEQAPLLANDAQDEESIDSREPNGNRKESRPNWVQRSWRWLFSHKMMVVILLLILGGIVALAVYFAYLNTNADREEETENVCLTPSCVLASSAILENMSPNRHNIDPCTNFDKFVCEGFDEKHDLRPDQGAIFTGILMAETGEQILRHVLESPFSVEGFGITSSADRNIFEKLQELYQACLDEPTLNDIRSSPLLDVLRNIETLFPAKRAQSARTPYMQGIPRVLTQQRIGVLSESDDSLTQTVTYLAEIGVTALIDVGVGPDDRDPDTVVPSLNAPDSPGLPSKEYYEDPQIVKRYGIVIGQVLEALLKEASASTSFDSTQLFAQSTELVENIVDFESRLAKATPATEDAEDVTFYYNPLTFAEIDNMLPQLSVSSLMATLAPHAPDVLKIIVESPLYLETLASLLNKTSSETLQAYFVWKTVQQYAYKVEDEAVKPLKRFNNELLGKESDAKGERWRTCVKVADNGLGWILSGFFVQKAFSKEAKNFGDKIVSDIKLQFIDKLNAADWMSEDVKKLGVKKVHAIIQKIGYPTKSPDIRNASALESYYGAVNISKHSYFENALSIAKFDTKREWSALGRPTNRDEWGMTADTVNAYYNPPGNEIVFPAGIMQKPVFYDPSVPQYLTYGAFGAVSGHELSHAFDSTGRHYDEKGNYTDWWNNRTVEAFTEKAQCFIDQYEDFVVSNPRGKDLHVNGRLTLGENIADVGGLNAAFKAWKAVEGQKESEQLPGLQDFSKEQLFFISYSNWWCGKARPETAVEQVYRDPHAPTWARILGTMANSRDFREAFDCPVKEPRCELW